MRRTCRVASSLWMMFPICPTRWPALRLFRDLPGNSGPLLIDLSGQKTWPGAAPFRIRLVEGAPSAEWDETARLLTVALPKAAVVKVRLSSAPPSQRELELLGIWDWIAGESAEQRENKLRAIAAEGGHWMLTPFRELTLVHAVSCPLEPPCFDGFSIQRKPGETCVGFSGKIAIHGPSTGKAEVHASWRDRVDEAQTGNGNEWSPPAENQRHHAQPFHLVSGDPSADRLDCAGNSQEFGDTRYRRVSYRVAAASRFRDNFSITDPDEAFVRMGEEAVEVDILNSARPSAPLIEYVIPTFGWERSEHSDAIESRREGGGVRVYLRRPWFSSGDGELLGVVVPHGPVTLKLNQLKDSLHVPEDLKNYVTQWGYDPVWLANPAYQLPTVQDFPLAVARESGVTIEEAETRPGNQNSWWLSVAGHGVNFDSERQLWYSDIVMETGPAYFPFVRLALARYQPRSVQGAELSRVVLADFIQLAPDRLAWISSIPDNPHQLQVSVSGPAPLSLKHPLRNMPPTAMGVRIEMLHPGSEEEVWLPVDPGWQLLVRTQITPATTVWNGIVTLPAPRGSRRFRLILGEVEILPADRRESESGARLFMVAVASYRAGFRPVYMDVIEI
jgi:hypothetical protein